MNGRISQDVVASLADLFGHLRHPFVQRHRDPRLLAQHFHRLPALAGEFVLAASDLH